MLTQFLVDYEDRLKEEEKIETFKQALIQAYPQLYEKIYGNATSFPEDIEQVIPDEGDMMEIDELMDLISSKQTVRADQLIYEE